MALNITRKTEKRMTKTVQLYWKEWDILFYAFPIMMLIVILRVYVNELMKLSDREFRL